MTFFAGQNCRNFEFVPKILSAENIVQKVFNRNKS